MRIKSKYAIKINRVPAMPQPLDETAIVIAGLLEAAQKAEETSATPCLDYAEAQSTDDQAFAAYQKSDQRMQEALALLRHTQAVLRQTPSALNGDNRLSDLSRGFQYLLDVVVGHSRPDYLRFLREFWAHIRSDDDPISSPFKQESEGHFLKTYSAAEGMIGQMVQTGELPPKLSIVIAFLRISINMEIPDLVQSGGAKLMSRFKFHHDRAVQYRKESQKQKD